MSVGGYRSKVLRTGGDWNIGERGLEGGRQIKKKNKY